MSTHKKILTITGAVISLALLLALPLMNGFKSSLYSTLADPQPIPPVVPLTDGDVNSDNDNFSSDVDIDGDYAIVGAWNDSSNGYYQNGAAYIFYNNPSDNPDMGWVQQAKLTGPGYYSYFGFSVGIDAVNGRAIVGAYNSVQGIVRIYEKDYNGTNSWGQRAQTNCPDGNLGFGRWVDIDGDYAVVSNDYYNSSTGRAYILKKDYNPGNPGVPLPNNWGVYKTLSVGNSNSYFGSSVAIDGNNIIIGERYYLNTTYPWYPGRVYIYHKDYTCPQSDCWGNGSPMSYFQGWYGYDNLGVDVDIDGDYAIAGTNGNQYAYIYRYNSGMDNWFQETNIYRPEYYFGKGVSIQDSGQGKIYAAIGTGNSNVYMYSGDGYGNWNEKYLIGTNYYPLNGNWGGISISDKYVIYGNYSYSSDGAAFIAGYMEATCGNQIIERPAESCDDGNTNDNDGCSSTCWKTKSTENTSPTDAM